MKIPEISEVTTWRNQLCTVHDRSKHKDTGAITLWLFVEGQPNLQPAPLEQCRSEGYTDLIQVGDRVNWGAAPHHVNTWNPFTVVSLIYADDLSVVGKTDLSAVADSLCTTTSNLLLELSNISGNAATLDIYAKLVPVEALEKCQ